MTKWLQNQGPKVDGSMAILLDLDIGLPEKIGGWINLLILINITWCSKSTTCFDSIAGEKYVAIGTSQGLFLYYEGEFFDITPLDMSYYWSYFDATSGSATVTVNKTSHGLLDGRYITFSSVTVPTGSGYATTDFTEILLKY